MYSENQKTVKKEVDFYTQVMILNCPMNIMNCLLCKNFKYNLDISYMSSSYTRVFWVLLYVFKTLAQPLEGESVHPRSQSDIGSKFNCN